MNLLEVEVLACNSLKSIVFSEGGEMTGSSKTHMLYLSAIFRLDFSIELKIYTPVIAVLLSKEQGATRQNITPLKTRSEYK